MLGATASHTSKESPTSASHVQDPLQTTASHVGGMEVDKKPGRRSFKPKFPCKICKGDHLTHLCPGIPEVQRIWSEFESSSTPTSDMVPRQSHQPLVDHVAEPVQSLADYTPLLGGEAPNKRVCLISSTESSSIGGIPVSSNVPPPSSKSVSFDWDSLAEPRLPSAAPFQIKVRVNSTNVYRCMVDEGSSASIISSLTWKALGSPKLLTAQSQLLAYDRRPGESMGVLPQLPITLGGKTVLIDMMVVDSPLDFNMLLGRDYVYAMNVVVSSLFRVMCFPHNGNIVTIDQLASDNHHPNSTLLQSAPWFVPSVQVDSTPPRVNYVALNPQCSIASKKDPLVYYSPSWDLVPAVDREILPIGTWDPLIPSFDPCSSHDFSELVLPSQEELFEAMSYDYQRSPWTEPCKGFVQQNYYA